MANATISELAKVVGVAVEKLLSQVKEAGLPHTKAGDVISNEDKNTLLQFLRSSHGERAVRLLYVLAAPSSPRIS